MKKKNVFAICMMIASLFLLEGCSGTKDPSATEDTAKTEETLEKDADEASVTEEPEKDRRKG